MDQSNMNTEKLLEQIPSLDLSDFSSGTAEQKNAFVQNLGDAFNNIGFVAIKGHGLSDTITQSLYEAAAKFFGLPETTKQNYEVPNGAGQRGYTSPGKEKAKGHSTGDLKEFYHVGQPADHDSNAAPLYEPNVFPAEVPEFEKYSLEVFKTLELTGLEVLRAIAIYLNLDPHYFDDKVINGNSILRQIHYFPIQNPQDLHPDAVRAAAHGDINLITLLMGASADGLQVQRRDGHWVPITALPGQIIVNVGDMLDRLTNHVLKSTIHRVVNPPIEKMGNSRYSIPFFMHPKADTDLSSLPGCISQENPKRYPDSTAGGFLDERLRELGLKK